MDLPPVRGKTPDSEHVLRDPRHRDHAGACAIRGPSSVGVREGLGREEEDHIGELHRGPDGFRRLRAVRFALPDEGEHRVRPQVSSRRGEGLADPQGFLVGHEEDLLPAAEGRARAQDQARPFLHERRMRRGAHIVCFVSKVRAP